MRVTVALFVVVLVARTCLGGDTARPPSPYYDFGACPFECCVYRSWVAVKATPVHTSRDPRSPIAFRLARGERVRALTGVVVTTSAGEAVTLREVTIAGRRVRPGERVYVLTNLGEGYNKVWYRGRMGEAQIDDDTLYRVERRPESTWWVKVRNRRGKVGWSNQADDFGDNDSCG
jgi:hypothetical protein